LRPTASNNKIATMFKAMLLSCRGLFGPRLAAARKKATKNGNEGTDYEKAVGRFNNDRPFGLLCHGPASDCSGRDNCPQWGVALCSPHRTSYGSPRLPWSSLSISRRRISAPRTVFVPNASVPRVISDGSSAGDMGGSRWSFAIFQPHAVIFGSRPA